MRDQRAAESLLVLKNADPGALIEIARKSWSRKDGFNCKHAVSIAGFAARFNEIRAEAGLLRPAQTTEGF